MAKMATNRPGNGHLVISAMLRFGCFSELLAIAHNTNQEKSR